MRTAVKTRSAATLERVRGLPETMRATAIDAFGGPSALSIHSLPVPVRAALSRCGRASSAAMLFRVSTSFPLTRPPRAVYLPLPEIANRDNAVQFDNLFLQIEPVQWRATLAGCTVKSGMHQFHEFLVAGNHVIFHLFGCDFGEELPSARDLRFLDLP
jgi:hypothetical protein